MYLWLIVVTCKLPFSVIVLQLPDVLLWRPLIHIWSDVIGFPGM